MGKKRRKIDKRKSDAEFGEDYTAMDVASYTEMTGAAMRPPLTDAEVENYSDIIPVPQQRTSLVKPRKREERL